MTRLQKAISHKGIGKWQTYDSLKNYRKARNKKNKQAKLSRRRNRK
jgi:hypothetical protein